MLEFVSIYIHNIKRKNQLKKNLDHLKIPVNKNKMTPFIEKNKEFDIDDLETLENLDEGLISSTFNAASALLIAKKLMSKIENWDAYELGLIDLKGKPTDKIPNTKEEKEAMSLFNRFVLGIKRILLFFVGETGIKFLVSYYVIKNIKQ